MTREETIAKIIDMHSQVYRYSIRDPRYIAAANSFLFSLDDHQLSEYFKTCAHQYDLWLVGLRDTP